MTPLIIEQMARRPDLLPAVARWIYEEWWEGSGASLDTLTDLLQPHLIPDQIPTTLVALQGARPVGTATLLAHDVGTEQWSQLSPWLAAVYVVPECRRGGIGGRLVNEVVVRARAFGAEVLYLLTTEREDFYAQLGWRVFDRAEEKTVMVHGL